MTTRVDGRGCADQAGGLEPAAGHGDVQQGEVGLVLTRGPNGRGRVAGGGHDLQLLVGRQGRDEPVQEERVVVRDQDPDRLGHGSSAASSASGRSARTRVPACRGRTPARTDRPAARPARACPPGQGGPRPGFRAGVEPGALVAHLDGQEAILGVRHVHLDSRAAAVPGGIREGLREDPIEGDLRRERSSVRDPLDVDTAAACRPGARGPPRLAGRSRPAWPARARVFEARPRWCACPSAPPAGRREPPAGRRRRPGPRPRAGPPRHPAGAWRRRGSDSGRRAGRSRSGGAPARSGPWSAPPHDGSGRSGARSGRAGSRARRPAARSSPSWRTIVSLPWRTTRTRAR